MDPGIVADDKILNNDVNSPQEQRKKKTVNIIGVQYKNNKIHSNQFTHICT